MKLLQNDHSLEEKANSFIDLANENGGEDNITLVLIEFTDESEGGEINDDWKKNKRPL